MTSTPRRWCWPSTRGGAAGGRFVRDLDPARLVEVALDRRAPVGGDAQLRQGALDAHRPARGVDAPDVRRDAAGERRAGEWLGAGQAELAQRLARTRSATGDGDRAQPPSRVSHAPTRDSISLTSACSAWLAGVATPSARAAAGDEAVEVIDLARLAARHVLRGRRELAPASPARSLHRLERGRERQVDAFGRGERDDLGDDRLLQRADRRARPARRSSPGRCRRSRCRRSSPSAWPTARP